MSKQFKELMLFVLVIIICAFGLNLFLVAYCAHLINLAWALSAYESIAWILVMWFANYLKLTK